MYVLNFCSLPPLSAEHKNLWSYTYIYLYNCVA